MSKILYIVATPIGNLKDISSRAIETLENVDCILCEDTRVSEKLIEKTCSLKKYKLISYNDHNAQTMIPKIIEKMKTGETFALISDAGTPLISDPGYKLVNACIENELPYTFIPGACSVISALVLSGFPSDRFLFDGFANKKNFEELSKLNSSVILFESPKRLLNTLQEMKKYFSNRRICVVREISKIFEEIKTGSIESLEQHFSNTQAKGEIVIVISPPETDICEKLTSMKKLMSDMLCHMPSKEVCKILSDYTKLSKNVIYNFIKENFQNGDS